MKKVWILMAMLLFCMTARIGWAAEITTQTNWDFSQQTTDSAGEGWQWQADKKTLTLNGAHIVLEPKTDGIILPDQAIVKVEKDSENTIEIADHGGLYGIIGLGSLNIIGEGDISIIFQGIEDNTGIEVAEASITIQDVNLEIINSRYGIYSHEDVNLSNVNLRVKGYHKKDAYGISAGGDIKANKCEVAMQNLRVSLSSNGMTEIVDCHLDLRDGGIYPSSLLLKDSTLRIAALEEGIKSWTDKENFAYEKTLQFIDSDIEISADDDGIWLDKGYSLIITNSDVRCKSAGAALYSYGLENDQTILAMNSGYLELNGYPAIELYVESDAGDITDKAIQIAVGVEMPTNVSFEKVMAREWDEDKVVMQQVGYYFMEDGAPLEYDWNCWDFRQLGETAVKTLSFGKPLAEKNEAINKIRGDIYYQGERQPSKAGYGEVYIDSAGRTMVPVRFISEIMGYQVKWDGTEGLVDILGGPCGDVCFKVNSMQYNISGGYGSMSSTGKLCEMDTIAAIQDGRVYVPLRYLVQGLGGTIKYDEDSQNIYITAYDEEQLRAVRDEKLYSGLKTIGALTKKDMNYQSYNDKEAMKQRIEWLTKTGYRTEFDGVRDQYHDKTMEQMFASQLPNDEKIKLCVGNVIDRHWETQSLLGYDVVLAVRIADDGVEKELWTEEEAISALKPAFKLILDSFENWSEVADNYYEGLCYYNLEGDSRQIIIDWQMGSTLRIFNWQETIWQLSDELDTAVFRVK